MSNSINGTGWTGPDGNPTPPAGTIVSTSGGRTGISDGSGGVYTK